MPFAEKDYENAVIHNIIPLYLMPSESVSKQQGHNNHV